MKMTEAIVRTIEKSGIVLADRTDVFKSIDDAIEQGRFHFLTKVGRNIGFFTFEQQGQAVFVNNLFIEKKFRGSFNLLSIRKILRAKYQKIGAFAWKNRKKGKPVVFKEKVTAVC